MKNGDKVNFIDNSTLKLLIYLLFFYFDRILLLVLLGSLGSQEAEIIGFSPADQFGVRHFTPYNKQPDPQEKIHPIVKVSCFKIRPPHPVSPLMGPYYSAPITAVPHATAATSATHSRSSKTENC